MNYGRINTFDYRENWYALMISILKGWTSDKSLNYMKVTSGHDARGRKDRRRKFRVIAKPCAVIHTVTGESYRTIGKMFNVDCATAKHAIDYYREEFENEHVV